MAALLRAAIAGEVRVDHATRVLYSTDASIYQIEPLGVVYPRTQDDLQAAVEIAAKHGVPVLPRGSGTSLAGQAIGPALILDCSRWLNTILDLDAERRTATVEPGVLLSRLNEAAGRHGLQFGPDPASAERATMGGVIANNATGAHSILYGMAADHLVSADVVLADGSRALFDEMEIATASRGVARTGTLHRGIIDAATEIREKSAPAVRERFPRTWRNSAGYRLNYLLPWSASRPPQWPGESYPPVRAGTINLAHLLAGSEGTLAVIGKATVALVAKPAHKVLAVLPFSSISAACDAVPGMLERRPSAIELIPQLLIRLGRAHRAYSEHMTWAIGDPVAVLVVEFSGDTQIKARSAARALGANTLLAETDEAQSSIWSVRKVGLGILDSRPGTERPLAFIEDCAIPVDSLGRFVREIERILAGHRVEGGIYAHASAGCLHIRPILDLGTPSGRAALRSIAEQTKAVTLQLGGSMSSEHGDGIARAEWLRETFGPELVAAMRQLKNAADPRGLLGPEKQLDAPAMDSTLRAIWNAPRVPPAVDAQAVPAGDSLAGAARCNGQGLCRKEAGLMCPSYQATRDEMHSTRGRANLLTALITLGAPRATLASPAVDVSLVESVKQALDLCLMCQGCRAECPSGVDMARLKSSFDSRYYSSHARPWRDYVFGYFHVSAAALANLAPLSNWILAVPAIARLAQRALRLTPSRPLPRFTRAAASHSGAGSGGGALPGESRNQRVLLLRDAHGRYVDSSADQAAAEVLQRLGYDVVVVPRTGAGAALMSKGMLPAAQKHAAGLLAALDGLDPAGALALVGNEPAEINAVRSDYADWVPEKAAAANRWASRAMSVEEFLMQAAREAMLRIVNTIRHSQPQPNPKVLLHPHCHQQAQSALADGPASGVNATMSILRLCGYEVQRSPGGCCGMAGTFGYEAEHYELSMQIGELSLLPLVRVFSRGTDATRGGGSVEPSCRITATGAACRLQILHGTGVRAVHPIQLVREALFGAAS